MNSHTRFEEIYNSITDEKDLHWYRENVNPILEKSVKEFTGSHKALDIGCGTGPNSIFLAKNGFEVIGLDFVSSAIERAQQKAVKEHLKIKFETADVLTWKTDDKFDFILDSGCLHTINDSNRALYKKQLTNWLTPSTEYVLFHFARAENEESLFQGPRPKSREEIERFLAPELNLKEFEHREGGRPMNVYVFVSTLKDK